MVRNGHAMGVATEIAQHVSWTAEGTLQVHDPVLSIERSQPRSEDLGLSEKLEVSLEVELTILESLLESVNELAAKNFLQDFFGKEEIVA